MERRVIVRNVTASPLASPPPGNRPTRNMIAHETPRWNAAGSAFVGRYAGTRGPRSCTPAGKEDM
ncbi:hypothetical protein GCM10009527_018600 [Actinomadura nitritigenes]